jgi:hypothetical protein
MENAHRTVLPPVPAFVHGRSPQVAVAKPTLRRRIIETRLDKLFERKPVVPQAEVSLENPFIVAQAKWDELNRDLMLTKDDLAQTKEENGRLNNAIVEADNEIARIKASHDKAMNEALAKHSAELAAKDEFIATLTRERDVFKTFSIQQTVRLRDFGEQALRIVADSRVATMGDPAVDAYAKPIVPAQLEKLTPEDEELLASITNETATAAAA